MAFADWPRSTSAATSRSRVSPAAGEPWHPIVSVQDEDGGAVVIAGCPSTGLARGRPEAESCDASRSR